MSRFSFPRLARSAFALTLAGSSLATGAVLGASPVSAAPGDVVGCVDWSAYAAGAAPSGSGNLGTAGGSQNQATGSSITLAGILGSDVDMRITFAEAHALALLDPGASADFDEVPAYRAALGDVASREVFRYWPQSAQRGGVTFEFFQTGTTNRAEVELDTLLTGGVRKFASSTWGVSEFALRNGGPGGSAVQPSAADPDAQAIDGDGGGNGITGFGSNAIIQLDRPTHGVAIDSAFNEARSSFVNVGSVNDRDWTILDWGSPMIDTITWDIYGQGGVADATGPDPESADPAAFTQPHTGLSSYIAAMCLTIPGDVVPDYDLALAKVLTGYAADTRVASYQIDVRNQGTVSSGAFAVTDTLPAGTGFAGASNGGTAAGTVVTWSIPAGEAIDPGETLSLTLELDIDDPSQAPFINTAEISSDSGDDTDSSPDTDAGDDPVIDVTSLGDLSTDAADPGDQDDHDIAVLRLDHSIGNEVWLDTNNNGSVDANERGICDVWVDLFIDADGNGLPDDLDANGAVDSGDAIRNTTTDCDGLWLVDSLAPGRYLVGIPASEFAADGPLNGLVSSDATASNVDDDVDNDDNCSPTADGGQLTGVVTLGTDEPVAESPNNATASLDASSNLTIDCGFYTAVAGSPSGGAGAVPAQPTIPRTGSETTGLAGLGLMLMAMGGGLVVWSRRPDLT